MSEEFIGKIVVAAIFGIPTAYWIGRIFADILKGKLIHWANEAGYMRGIDEGERRGFDRAVRLGKLDEASDSVQRIERRIMKAIERERVMSKGDVDSIEVNHRRTADLITVSTSEDGMTVRLHISQPMGTFPLQMWMGGNDIVLNRTQWLRLSRAINKAFTTTGDATDQDGE